MTVPTPEEKEFFRAFREADKRQTLRNEALQSEYEALADGDKKRRWLGVYRCATGCTLLVVWRAVDDTIALRISGYKLSPQRNAATSVEAARRRNTVDAERRQWKPRYWALDDSQPDVQCDHLQQRRLTPAEIAGDIEPARPGKPTRRVLT